MQNARAKIDKYKAKLGEKQAAVGDLQSQVADLEAKLVTQAEEAHKREEELRSEIAKGAGAPKEEASHGGDELVLIEKLQKAEQEISRLRR